MKYQLIEVATSDVRGSIADILWKSDFEHAAIIRSPDASTENPVHRGNHYHKLSTQAIFIVEGELTYWYKESPDSAEIRCTVVPKNGLVSTPPYEVHALEITQPTTFIAFSKGLRGGDSYEEDTFRVHNIIGVSND